MARVLHVIPHLEGHVRPHLAIASALLDRGHEVAIAGPATVAAKVEAAGCRPLTLRRLAHFVREFEGFNRGSTPFRAGPRWALTGYLSPRRLRAELDDVAEAIEAFHPDLMVYDQFASGSVFVAPDLYDVPPALFAMSLFSTFTHEGPLPPLQVPGGGRRALAANAECGFWRGVIRFVENTQVAQANEHRTRFGMPRLSGDVDDFYRRLPLILLTGLPGFVEGPTPANVCCVGPCRWREPVSEKTAARVRALVGAGSEPLVCVSLTSVHAHGRLRESFLRVCIAALAELPVRAVVLTGGLPIEDTPAPAHVVIERWLPHRLLFPHVSALVTNGGAGTVGAGLADGVPMVVAPVHSDQPENAWRVECNGLGLRLSSRATVEELRAAARRVLSDATILNNVTATSARIQRLEGAARAAKLLEDCADSAAAVRSTSSRRPGGLRAIT